MTSVEGKAESETKGWKMGKRLKAGVGLGLGVIELGLLVGAVVCFSVGMGLCFRPSKLDTGLLCDRLAGYNLALSTGDLYNKDGRFNDTLGCRKHYDKTWILPIWFCLAVALVGIMAQLGLAIASFFVDLGHIWAGWHRHSINALGPDCFLAGVFGIIGASLMLRYTCCPYLVKSCRVIFVTARSFHWGGIMCFVSGVLALTHSLLLWFFADRKDEEAPLPQPPAAELSPKEDKGQAPSPSPETTTNEHEHEEEKEALKVPSLTGSIIINIGSYKDSEKKEPVSGAEVGMEEDKLPSRPAEAPSTATQSPTTTSVHPSSSVPTSFLPSQSSPAN